MMQFEEEVIDLAIALHTSKGRKKWKYSPMADKQRKILSPYIAKEKLSKIDKGAASQLITTLFEQNEEGATWRIRL